MKITVHEVDHKTVGLVKKAGAAFEVRAKLMLHAENGIISYTIVDVPPYTKQYDPEQVDPETYVANPERVVLFAYVDEELAGQIRIFRNWNGYAYIDDIAVDENYRGRGVGRVLMERGIKWAKANGFPGMMLETQDNNVAGCRLYASCGFELRGFDTHLYKAMDSSTDEIALYWYLMF